MDTSRFRILLVEDHAQTSQIMARLVRARGFEVETAGSLAEASERVKQGNIGFIISDLGLPDGNACDFMTTVRAQHGLKGAAISGFGMDGDIARSREAGFVMHLTKPIRINELDEVLKLARRELENRQAGESPGKT